MFEGRSKVIFVQRGLRLKCSKAEYFKDISRKRFRITFHLISLQKYLKKTKWYSKYLKQRSIFFVKNRKKEEKKILKIYRSMNCN